MYGQPIDSEAFENYYADTHLPLVSKMAGFDRAEYTIFMNQDEKTPSVFYRMAEFWFSNPEALQQTMASTGGQAVAADLSNFATGGVTVMVGMVMQ